MTKNPSVSVGSGRNRSSTRPQNARPNIAGATNQSYTAASVDVAAVLRANVTATNSKGSTVATSQETGPIAPAVVGGHAISISQVSLPNRLIVDNVKYAPTVITSRAPVVARFHVSDTRGFSIQGALVYALGLPYGWTHNGPEVVTDGENGFLSPVGDIDKMADDAARLLVDAKLRKEFGKRARASAIERYSTHKVIPQYIEFYERILKSA